MDPLTEYLILSGHPDESVIKGLEVYVVSWEEEVEWIEKLGAGEEFGLTLFQRSQLYLVMQHASSEQIAPYREKITQADQVFMRNTTDTDTSSESHLDGMGNPDKKVHWWLYRRPL